MTKSAPKTEKKTPAAPARKEIEEAMHHRVAESVKPARKSGPKKTIAIQEACAAEGCVTPPAETLDGLRLCSVHATAKVDAELVAKAAKDVEKALAALAATAKTAPEAKKVAGGKKPTKTQVEADAELMKATLPPEAAKLVDATAKAAAEKVRPDLFKAPEAPAKAPKAKAEKKDAAPVIAKLVAKGWTFATIGQALGGLNPGYAKAWSEGTGCRRLPELEELLEKAAPTPAPKVVRGALQAPRAAASPKAAKPSPKTDPRQLVLGIRDYLDEVLSLLPSGK